MTKNRRRETSSQEKIKNIALGVYDAINTKDSETLCKLFSLEIIRHATAQIEV